jgi:hypothetical protein
MRMAHHQMQSLAIGQFQRQGAQRLGASAHEGRAQQQVLGRIAGQRQFGRHHHAGALCVGLARGLRHEACIAGQVTHRRVDLRQRHFHAAKP